MFENRNKCLNTDEGLGKKSKPACSNLADVSHTYESPYVVFHFQTLCTISLMAMKALFALAALTLVHTVCVMLEARALNQAAVRIKTVSDFFFTVLKQ